MKHHFSLIVKINIAVIVLLSVFIWIVTVYKINTQEKRIVEIMRDNNYKDEDMNIMEVKGVLIDSETLFKTVDPSTSDKVLMELESDYQIFGEYPRVLMLSYSFSSESGGVGTMAPLGATSLTWYNGYSPLLVGVEKRDNEEVFHIPVFIDRERIGNRSWDLGVEEKYYLVFFQNSKSKYIQIPITITKQITATEEDEQNFELAINEYREKVGE